MFATPVSSGHIMPRAAIAADRTAQASTKQADAGSRLGAPGSAQLTSINRSALCLLDSVHAGWWPTLAMSLGIMPIG